MATTVKTTKLSGGSLKRNGEAIQVQVGVTENINVGDRVVFNNKTYLVQRKGGRFTARDNKDYCYLYVEAVKDPAIGKSPFFVKEVPVSKGRGIALASSVQDGEPTYLHAEVKPRKREVIAKTTHHSFMESRGYSQSSTRAATIAYESESSPVYLLAMAFLAGDDAALLGLVDALEERGEFTKNHKAKNIARFVEIARQQKPYQYILEQRTAKAFADCKFKVGDKVKCWKHSDRGEQEVLAVNFVREHWGGEWRVSVLGMNAPQSHFAKVEEEEPKP